jgi:hypothetical protein
MIMVDERVMKLIISKVVKIVTWFCVGSWKLEENKKKEDLTDLRSE